jgi:hypothetical protein
VPPESDNTKIQLYGKEKPSWPLLYAGKAKAPVLTLAGVLGEALLKPANGTNAQGKI